MSGFTTPQCERHVTPFSWSSALRGARGNSCSVAPMGQCRGAAFQLEHRTDAADQRLPRGCERNARRERTRLLNRHKRVRHGVNTRSVSLHLVDGKHAQALPVQDALQVYQSAAVAPVASFSLFLPGSVSFFDCRQARSNQPMCAGHVCVCESSRQHSPGADNARTSVERTYTGRDTMGGVRLDFYEQQLPSWV